MKTMLIVLCVLWAATAVGQTTGSVRSNESIVFQINSHPEHAAPHDMASERPLVGGGANTYTFAHGERPLWEFGTVSEQPSLGEIARQYRKEKLTAKKADFVFEKQGR